MVRKSMIVAAATLLAPVAAGAHHSFAAFFDDSRMVKIQGEVEAYRFGNPHGSIVLKVQSRSGDTHMWRVETSAPVTLQRRGWSRDTLKVGQKVMIEGWQARNGQRYLRLRQAYDANGKPVVQQAFNTKDD